MLMRVNQTSIKEKIINCSYLQENSALGKKKTVNWYPNKMLK